jgi:MFS family permease
MQSSEPPVRPGVHVAVGGSAVPSREAQAGHAAQSARRVLFATLIGTTIEYFDFYAYTTATVLVFPKLFFPAADPSSATLQSFATLALAFVARPFGSALFGHFGDRVGRKATLAAALLTTGLSTVLIGLLPTYAAVGVLAPVLLALCRVGQGAGLGGEWGGAVLLATENAPPGKRSWYGMFPQLGAPLGFCCATGTFMLLSGLSEGELFSWGWRIPFLASAILVFIGLYVRLRLTETPEFRQVIAGNQRVRIPLRIVCAGHLQALLLGTYAAIAAFVIFFLMTVFSLTGGTSELGFTRNEFLSVQTIGVLFFALMIPVSALLADRFGLWATLSAATVGVVAFGIGFPPLLHSGAFAGGVTFFVLGFCLAGLSYGPLGAALAELFPAPVRYTGASLAFNLASILGTSLAPYTANWLATNYGLASVGYFLSAVALLSLIALRLIANGQAHHGLARQRIRR